MRTVEVSLRAAREIERAEEWWWEHRPKAPGAVAQKLAAAFEQLASQADINDDGMGPVQTIYGEPPRDTFPAAVSFCLTGIAIVDNETLWVTDSCTGILIELWRQPVP